MCSIYDNLRKGLGNVSKDVYLYFLHCLVFLQGAIAVIYRHCQDLNGLFIIVNF